MLRKGAQATDKSYRSATIGDAFEQAENHVLLGLRKYGVALNAGVKPSAFGLGQVLRASVVQLLVWPGKHRLPGRINWTRAAPCYGTVDRCSLMFLRVFAHQDARSAQAVVRQYVEVVLCTSRRA